MTVEKNAFVGCALNVRVRMLLKGAVKRIIETVAVVLRCLVNKVVVKWFAQRRTYRNYMQG